MPTEFRSGNPNEMKEDVSGMMIIEMDAREGAWRWELD
jgi:hypothetical protein